MNSLDVYVTFFTECYRVNGRLELRQSSDNEHWLVSLKSFGKNVYVYDKRTKELSYRGRVLKQGEEWITDLLGCEIKPE